MTPAEAITNLQLHAQDYAAPSDLREAVRVMTLVEAEHAKLREAFRWFRRYPEFIPNPDQQDKWGPAVREAAKIFAD